MDTSHQTSARTLYDLVKIKVWLQDDAQPANSTPHYYVLSRYMLARSLQAASISYSSAIKASLLLKRHLVDSSMLSLDQATLEGTLFEIIRLHGLATEDEIQTWSEVVRFQQARRPLIILLLGDPSDAKTRVAHEISARMHFNYVILTEALEDMMLDEEKDDKKDYLFRSVQNDVAKAIKDGKSIIIEGGSCLERFMHDNDMVKVLQSDTGAPVLQGAPERLPLLVPMVVAGRGSAEYAAREFLCAGRLPIFEVDDCASPEQNTEDIVAWILGVIRESGERSS